MGDKSYSVRRFQPGDRDILIKLVGKVWDESAVQRLKMLWTWKYDDNPHNATEGHNSVVLVCDGQPVGYIGFIGGQIKVDDQIVPMCWGSDLFVDPDHQGRGWLVLKYITEESEKICAGSSIPEKIYKIYKRLGGTDVTTIISCKRVLNGRQFLQERKLGWVKVMLGRLALRISGMALRMWRWRSGMSKVIIQKMASFDERFDTLWDKISPEYGLISVRDSKFLNWRFRDCPNRKYETFTAEIDGELKGYVVVRGEEHDGLCRGYVVDIFCGRNDQVTFHKLLDVAEKHLKTQGCQTVSFTTSANNAQLIKRFKRHAYLFQTVGSKMIANGGGPNSYRHLMPRFEGAVDFHLTRADTDLDYSYGEHPEADQRVLSPEKTTRDPETMVSDPV